jgi:hypothetical protein
MLDRSIKRGSELQANPHTQETLLCRVYSEIILSLCILDRLIISDYAWIRTRALGPTIWLLIFEIRCKFKLLVKGIGI